MTRTDHAPMPEAALQRLILARCNSIPGVWLWRSNVGTARWSGGVVRFGVKGRTDLQGLMRCEDGRAVPVFVEVKSATGRLTPEQVAFGARVKAMGACYIVARCLDDALDGIQGWTP